MSRKQEVREILVRAHKTLVDEQIGDADSLRLALDDIGLLHSSDIEDDVQRSTLKMIEERGKRFGGGDCSSANRKQMADSVRYLLVRITRSECMRLGITPCVIKPAATYAEATDRFHSPAASAGA